MLSTGFFQDGFSSDLTEMLTKNCELTKKNNPKKTKQNKTTTYL